MLPCPSPTLTPFSISLIVRYYGALLFSSELICVAGRPSAPIQHRTFPFKHHPSLSWIPFSFENGSWVFKKWTGSRAIQGVSNASRSARLLNAKQTVEQIKIKGSSLARLACCPHMPGGAVTVNHSHAASVLMLPPPLLLHNPPSPPKGHQPPRHSPSVPVSNINTQG